MGSPHSLMEQIHSSIYNLSMLVERRVPPPVNDKRCDGCSLKESCLPAVIAEKERGRQAARELFIVEGGM